MWCTIEGTNWVAQFNKAVHEAAEAIGFPNRESRLIRALAYEFSVFAGDAKTREFCVGPIRQRQREGLRIQFRFDVSAFSGGAGGPGVSDEFGLGLAGARLIADRFKVIRRKTGTLVIAIKWKSEVERGSCASSAGDREALKKAYRAILETHIGRRGSVNLKVAYQFGRAALARGLGISELVTIHSEVLAELRLVIGAAASSARVSQAIAECLAEASTPFEIQHRASLAAGRRVREVNSLLEQEPRRIARILHEEASQLLCMICVTADTLCPSGAESCQAGIGRLKGLMTHTADMLRSLSREMRPVMLEDLGLAPALRALGQAVAVRGGMDVEVNVQGIGRLRPSLEITIYRIIQEALGNVIRHSKANRIELRVERNSGVLLCSISDNGIGFEPAKVRQSGSLGLGLVGMRERAIAMNGRLDVESEPGRGATIRAVFPLRRAALPTQQVTPIRAAFEDVPLAANSDSR